MRTQDAEETAMRNVHEIRRTLDRNVASDLRSRLETLQAGRCSDVVDEAVWSENVAVAVQTIEVDWQRKRQIEASLDRIQTGGYGVCDACGGGIAEARLAALPWATRCVACQERQERLQAVSTPRGLVSIRDGFEPRFGDAA
jgi:DnaK suppressor protein